MKEYEKVFLKYQNDMGITSFLNNEKHKRFIWETYLAGKQDARDEILDRFSKNLEF